MPDHPGKMADADDTALFGLNLARHHRDRFNMGLFSGLKTTTPTNGALIMALSPLTTTLTKCADGGKKLPSLKQDRFTGQPAGCLHRDHSRPVICHSW